MYKSLSIAALLLSVSACSIEQKPAPYVDKSSERFSKSASRNISRGATPIYSNNDYIDAPASSAAIESRSLMPQSTPLAPINRNDGVIDFSSKAQSSDYIDSNQSAVPLAPLASNNQPKPVADEPVAGGKDYLDLGAVNKFGSASANTHSASTISEPKKTSKLLSAKPLAKPTYKEAVEATATTPIAEAPVATIETAAPVEAAAPAPAIQKIEHTTKLSEHESVTTTKTIERIENKTENAIKVPNLDEVKNGEAAIEKTPIVEAKKPAASTGKQFIRPVKGKVVGKFGNEPDGTFNDGIKIQAAKGTNVQAADGGEVVYSGNQLQGYGNMIIVRHANGYLTSYAHLEGLDIKKGAKVGQGDVIGHVGDTGNVSEPMLHFGVREGREPVDPQKFLK